MRTTTSIHLWDTKAPRDSQATYALALEQLPSGSLRISVEPVDHDSRRKRFTAIASPVLVRELAAFLYGAAKRAGA